MFSTPPALPPPPPPPARFLHRLPVRLRRDLADLLSGDHPGLAPRDNGRHGEVFRRQVFPGRRDDVIRRHRTDLLEVLLLEAGVAEGGFEEPDVARERPLRLEGIDEID